MKGLLFQYPAFLFGLSALAIPIILHLINRNVPKRIVFSSTRFIQKAQHLQAGKKHIRDWWVLLSRLIILAAVILLFASPMIAVERAVSENRTEEVVLFYDLSVSMNFDGFDKYVSDRTEELLKEHEQARFALIASSNKVEGSLPMGTSTAEMVSQVNQLQPTLVAGNHHAALAATERFFTPEASVKKILYIFSDLQRQDWATSRLPSLDLDLEVRFVSPPHSDGANIAISQVFPEIYVKDDKRRLRATIEVHNYSLTPTRVDLQLTAGDAVQSKSVGLRGDYSERIVLDLETPTSNIAIAEIISDEALLLDNSYFFWIGPKAPVKVAVMGDLESDPGVSTEIFFLRNALSVTIPGSEVYDTNVIAPDFIWSSSLTEFQCVFVLDAVSNYTDAEMGVFHDYVNQGGTLVYFSGNQSAANIAKLSQANLSSIRFLGYQGEVNQLRSYSVTSIQEGSPIVSIFEREQGDLFQFPVYKFAKISPAKQATTLLYIANDYPFLVQEELGDGNLFIFTTGLKPSWSEFPTSFSFLPLIHRIIEYSGIGKKKGIIEVTLGDNYGDAFVEAGLRDDHQLLPEPGVQLVQGIPVEINTTRLESDLRSTEQYELISHLAGVKKAGDSAAPTTQLAGNANRPLKKPLAWILLSFFVLELLIANKTKKGKLEF